MSIFKGGKSALAVFLRIRFDEYTSTNPMLHLDHYFIPSKATIHTKNQSEKQLHFRNIGNIHILTHTHARILHFFFSLVSFFVQLAEGNDGFRQKRKANNGMAACYDNHCCL